MNEINEKLREGCENALNAFAKLDDNQFSDICSRLEYVIGSYNNDKNPVGLHEYAAIASTNMKAYKKKNPRKINKKVIDGLDRAIKNFENLS